MEAVSGRVNSSGGRESAESNGDSQAADGDNRGAGTLQNSEDNARPVEQLSADSRHFWRRNFGAILSEFRRILSLFDHLYPCWISASLRAGGADRYLLRAGSATRDPVLHLSNRFRAR